MKIRNLLLAGLLMATSAMAQNNDEPISLRTMGSLMYGGSVTEMPDGSTFHGDHGYAQYYIPTDAHTYPIIMWHGIGQSGKCYETTYDGREGFQAILPRRHWATYIVDQPRRGRAGYTLSKVDTSELQTTHYRT